MKKLLCAIALLGALPLFAACEQTVEDAQQDVVETQQDAAENVQEEQQDVQEAKQEGAQDIREEQQDLQEAKQNEGTADTDPTLPPTNP